MLFLKGIARGDWYGAILRVRAAVNECGFVLEEHPYSGVMVNFRIELLREHSARFSAALKQRNISLDSESEATLGATLELPSENPIDAMLVILFPDGDPDKTHEVPSVPG